MGNVLKAGWLTLALAGCAVFTLAAVQLVVLYSLDGRPVLINPNQVTQLRQAREEGNSKKQLTARVSCVIRLTDGSYVTVAEDCETVQKLIEEAKP